MRSLRGGKQRRRRWEGSGGEEAGREENRKDDRREGEIREEDRLRKKYSGRYPVHISTRL